MRAAVLATLALAGAPLAQEVDERDAVVAVERIWDRAPHSAFPDLCRLGDALYVAFREGSGHVPGTNGVVRVLRSDDDGLSWRAVALLEERGVDLRDPKLSVTTAGRLMVVMGGSVYDGSTLVSRAPRVAFTDQAGALGPPRRVTLEGAAGSGTDWLWRVTWHEGVAWGVVYQSRAEAWGLHLVRSTDGLAWETVATLDVDGLPNEATLRFLPDGRMAALLRREGGDRLGRVGVAAAPFTEWEWSALPARLGGPNFVRLPDGRLLAGTRRYEGGTATRLAWLDLDGGFEPALDLPSGGDTSYPGLLVDDDRLRVVYYSSHEGKSAIYLATLRLAAM